MGLGEHDRKGKGGLDTGTARWKVRARVPEGPLDPSGLGSAAAKLSATEGAQGGDGEPGAEGKGHAGRPERLGGDRSAAPGDTGGEVDVRGVLRVSLKQSPQVLDGCPQELSRAWVVALGEGFGEDVATGPSDARTRGADGPAG